MNGEHVVIAISESQAVSGLLLRPDRPMACLVLAHGAGAGMMHPVMAATAASLYERGIATLRYQFPYMEQGRRRPDPPALAHVTVRAAVDAAHRRLPDVKLFAGGKSFGGRMTSQAQSARPLPDVQGLIFLGFPLHSAGKPSVDRARHLSEVHIPTLFLQGERDTMADAGLIEQVVAQLGPRATLAMFPDADHSFHVPARSGRKNEQVHAEVVAGLADWIGGR